MNDGKIYEHGTTASGVRVQRGWYAVDPNGHVVLVPVTAPLKAGWRVASQAEVDASKRKASGVSEVAPASKPAPRVPAPSSEKD